MIKSLSRLEWSIKGLVERMELFQGKGVHLVSQESSIDIRSFCIIMIVLEDRYVYRD